MFFQILIVQVNTPHAQKIDFPRKIKMKAEPLYGSTEGWQAFSAQVETVIIAADYNWTFPTVEERTQNFKKFHEAFHAYLKKRGFKYRTGPSSSTNAEYTNISKSSDRKNVFSIDKVSFGLDPVDGTVVTVSMTGFTIPTDNETRYFNEIREKLDSYAASLQGRSVSKR